MGTMAWCAADFRATQPRQLGAARPDFGPGTARRPPDRQEMQRHRARALCDHRRPCWQRSGRPWMAPREPLPLGPAAATNAPLPGMPQRRLTVRFALPSPQRTPAPSPSFSCAWAQPLLPPEAAQKLRGFLQWPTGLQEDVRHRCISKRSPGALERTPKIPLSSAETPAPFAAIMAKISHFTERMLYTCAHLASSRFALSSSI